MKSVSLLCIVMILTVLQSCNQHDIKDKYSTLKKLQLSDSIVLTNVGPDYNCVTLNVRNSEMQVNYLSKNNKIYSLNAARKITDSFQLPKELKDRNFDFYIDDSSGLYVFLQEDKTITYYSKGDKPRRVYTYHGPENKYLVCLFHPFLVTDSSVVLNYIENLRMYVTDERTKYFTSRSLAKFLLHNDSLILSDSFLTYPDMYKTNFYNEPYPYVLQISKDSIAAIFSASGDSYITNTATHTVTTHKIGHLFPNWLDPCPVDSMQSQIFNKKYDLQNDKFAKLLRDEVSKNFMIIQLLKVEDKVSGIYETQFSDKPVIVNILSSSFNVVDKYYLQNQGNDMFYGAYYFNKKLYVPGFTKNGTNTIHIYSLN